MMLDQAPLVPAVSYEHLLRLSDDWGLFEHAAYTVPRPAHGYCVDDVARGLIALVRAPRADTRLQRQARVYLQFVISAQAVDGAFHNRLGTDLRWQDQPTTEDWWGRAVWGLGTAVGRAPALARQAKMPFDRAVVRRSEWSRAMSYAALGAAEVLRVQPGHRAATDLLSDAVDVIGEPIGDDWMWPEVRLRYGNASLAEAVIAGGLYLKRPAALRRGLAMLDWLLRVETSGDHLSVTPVRGWSQGEPRPGFDQQPIEVAALADACARAYDITGDKRWRRGVVLSAGWFLGANDIGVSLVDSDSGGGCDGLMPHGRNENQGAESTLALISTLQQVDRLGLADDIVELLRRNG
jgi:hypothetical protein